MIRFMKNVSGRRRVKENIKIYQRILQKKRGIAILILVFNCLHFILFKNPESQRLFFNAIK